MTTFAQYLFSVSFPEEAGNFEDNEHFEQFRDNQILYCGLTKEKLDSPYYISVTNKPLKSDKLSKGTIYRRSHKAIRSSILRKKLSLLNIKRFLLRELNFYSQQMEEQLDEDLITEWKSQLTPHLEKLDAKSSFEALLGVVAKILTLPETGKTLQTYLDAEKKKSDEEQIDETEDDNSFKIPQ